MAKRYSIRTYSKDEALVNERRTHVVKCSAKLFTKKGYNQTNMRDLTNVCNMSAGSLYRYFGSKEEILFSIINTATSQQADYVEDIANNSKMASLTESLIHLIRKFFEWHDENQDITLFSYQESKNLPRNALVAIFESEGRILSVFEKLIIGGVEEGEFQVNDPGLMAHNIIVLGHAWALRRWYARRSWTFETYVKEQTDTILKLVSTAANTIMAEN